MFDPFLHSKVYRWVVQRKLTCHDSWIWKNHLRGLTPSLFLKDVFFFFFRDGANCQGVRKTRAKQGRKKNKARRATKASFGDKETGNANNKVRVQRNKVGDVGVDWPPNHFFLDSTFRYFCPFSWRCPKAGKAPMAMLASCAGYTAMAVPLLGLKEDGLIAKRKHLCLYWTYWILVAILVPGMVKNNE